MQNFSDQIVEIEATQNSNNDIAREFVSDENTFGKYLVGKNDDSKFLVGKFKIDGIIDDFASEGASWNSVPLIKSKDVPTNAIVVNCSTSVVPVSVEKMLLRENRFRVLSYSQLFNQFDFIKVPSFVEEMRADYKLNNQKWSDLFLALEDTESKETLISIINFRLSGDPKYMSGFENRILEQYFEDFMNYSNEVFADVGGFDGDTTVDFCKRYPDYNKIFFFEPSPANMTKAKKRLEGFNNIEYFNVGLSDKDEILYFNPDQGSASSINGSGSEKITVTALDIAVNEPVTFIKMDIEGWEINAINGCRRHIKEENPKLAIAVYHKCADFWQIPELILSINPNYKLYLRHYTEGWSETIMFFLPR